MCGLAGVFNLHRQQFSLDEAHLNRMKEVIAHRGPDQGTTWSSEEHGLWLAFTRLKIQDLSEAGRQPMMDAEQSVIICFNGEIYNYQLIREELLKKGYHFTSTGDTQVLIAAYKEWGIDFLYKLDGIFAIALYDFERRELFLIRDRIGVKPLYFSLQDGILSFTSEIKVFWELPWIKKNLSSAALYHYLTFMVTPAPYTAYEKTYKLPAGSYVKIDAQKRIFFTEWYAPITCLSEAEQKEFYNEEFCLEHITTLLVEAVRKRMVADVPVGAFLSGGVDSSLNVALMSRFSNNIKTFSIAFKEQEATNELKWARLIAQQFNTDHHEIVISEKEAFEFYESMVYHLDEPLADCVCIPFYYVASLARQQGVTVVQIGEGADELFVGYEVYIQYKKVFDTFWRPFGKFVPATIKQGLFKLSRPFMSNPTYVDLLDKWANNQSLFWGGAIGFNESQKKKILSQSLFSQSAPTYDSMIETLSPGLNQAYDSFAIVDYHMKKFESLYPSADFFQQMLYLELKQRLPELLLMRADKMSMAVGVEAREPFLDYKLVEFLMHVPAHIKYQHKIKKYLLKKICQGILPDVIIHREKVGFAAPTLSWFTSGNYFPSYFEGLKKKNSTADLFVPAVNNLAKLYKNNQASLAVQQWVIQNIWAMK